MVSWSTIQSLLIFFGPILLPRALGFYRSLRAPANSTPTPLTRPASLALNLLFISAVVFLVSTLPYFSPTNIFTLTSSRLQTPTPVLFNRLSAIRPLTPTESSLRSLFESNGLEARLLYLVHGPSIATNPLATPGDADAATTYLLSALPSILFPHLFHLLILGLATSAPIAGPHAARWRTLATIVGLAVPAFEVWSTATYEYGRNAAATRAGDVEFWFWKVRTVRGLVVPVVDAVLGWVIYLSATGRAFVVPKARAERVEDIARLSEGVLGKLRGLGAVRNVVFRDTSLRGRVERYWVNEEGMMRSVLEEREVVTALTGVLEVADVERLAREAEGYVESVLGQIRLVQEDT